MSCVRWSRVAHAFGSDVVSQVGGDVRLTGSAVM